MFTTSQIGTSEGSGKNIATYAVTEDAMTKQVQRTALNEADGSDVGLSAKLGSVTESAPASDTASSGLNGRLQRIAQRLTTLMSTVLSVIVSAPTTPVKGVTSAITDTTSTQVIAAGGVGIKTYITDILVTNSHATVGTFIKILDGSTIIWEGYAAAAGGGFACHLRTPLVGSANTAVNVQAVTTGANFIASISGYQL